jgi:hypothetical protein
MQCGCIGFEPNADGEAYIIMPHDTAELTLVKRVDMYASKSINDTATIGFAVKIRELLDDGRKFRALQKTLAN